MNAPLPNPLPILAPLDRIYPSQSNPRKHFNPDAHAEMVSSVKQHGVLQPVLLRPLPMDHGPRNMLMSEKLDRFELVSGERRYRAAKEADLTEILAVVRDLSDVQVLEIQIIENLQREDVHPLEEAEGYERLMKSGSYTLEHLIERIGKSRSYVYARLKLLAMISAARDAFYAGKLNPSTALLIARIPEDRQAKALDEIVYGYDREPLSFRAARDHIERNFMLELSAASFKTGDANLVPTAGSCTDCPKRTGSQPELFADIKSGDLCIDGACYTNKRETDYLRKKALVEARGAKVIEGKAADKIAPHGASYLDSKEFVSLDKTCYDAPKPTPYFKLLGKDFEPDTYIKDPRTGALVPIAAKATIAEQLAAKGIDIKGTSQSATQREAERKAKAETLYRETLLKHISAELVGGYEPNSEDLRLIASAFLDRLGHDNLKRLEKLFGERDLDVLTQEQLFILLLECALISEVHVPGYVTNIGKPEKLLALAENLKMDHAAIKRDVQKSTKQKATKAATPPSDAAQAANPRRGRKPKPAAQAEEPIADKTDGKTYPAPASPGNEAATPPESVTQPSGDVKNAFPDPWPFPKGCRI